MEAAAARDINPFVRGFARELISVQAPFFPEIDRLASLRLTFSFSGWQPAEQLALVAELSEKFGSGTVFLSGPGLEILLPALDPDRFQELLACLPQSGPRHLEIPSGRGPAACPLWGPCLGQRSQFADLLAELAEELVKEIEDDFRVELAGCPLDCRLAMERADAGLMLSQDGQSLTVWLGGRHGFGGDPAVPRPYRTFGAEQGWPVLDLIFQIHDQWQEKHRPKAETLPEMVRRLGESALEKPVFNFRPAN
jgi:dissimilatory sulfite reductase (desulfoviridin) alpha/beta subunit